jgi:HSP20 family molecular chaperone IbpA
VRESDGEYLIALDVYDFTEAELTVELVGRRLVVRGDQLETAEDDGKPFRLHERLEEFFRLPDDADADAIKVFYRHGTLELHVGRVTPVARPLTIERRSPHVIHPEAGGV